MFGFLSTILDFFPPSAKQKSRLTAIEAEILVKTQIIFRFSVNTFCFRFVYITGKTFSAD